MGYFLFQPMMVAVMDHLIKHVPVVSVCRVSNDAVSKFIFTFSQVLPISLFLHSSDHSRCKPISETQYHILNLYNTSICKKRNHTLANKCLNEYGESPSNGVHWEIHIQRIDFSRCSLSTLK